MKIKKITVIMFSCIIWFSVALPVSAENICNTVLGFNAAKSDYTQTVFNPEPRLPFCRHCGKPIILIKDSDRKCYIDACTKPVQAYICKCGYTTYHCLAGHEIMVQVLPLE